MDRQAGRRNSRSVCGPEDKWQLSNGGLLYYHFSNPFIPVSHPEPGLSAYSMDPVTLPQQIYHLGQLLDRNYFNIT